jgi:Type II secretion system (T2SS), protein E, N-terminal domain
MENEAVAAAAGSGPLAYAREYWRHALPQCGEAGCTVARRLWRRARWWDRAIRLHGTRYCAPQCFENAMRQSLARISTTVLSTASVHHRIPLGLLLLSRGQLTNPQLRAALAAQKESGRHRLGEWLEQMGYATEQQVTAALGVQWACPVLPAGVNPDQRTLRLLPFRWLEAFRMLPLQFVPTTRVFYLAFSEGIDYSALYAVEQMLACHTEACLISGSAMNQALEHSGHQRGPGDLLFEGWRSAAEMARITCGYVLKLGAEEVRVVGCRGYVWVRLSTGQDVANLLFRRSPGATEPPESNFEPQPLSRRSAN